MSPLFKSLRSSKGQSFSAEPEQFSSSITRNPAGAATTAIATENDDRVQAVANSNRRRRDLSKGRTPSTQVLKPEVVKSKPRFESRIANIEKIDANSLPPTARRRSSFTTTGPPLEALEYVTYGDRYQQPANHDLTPRRVVSGPEQPHSANTVRQDYSPGQVQPVAYERGFYQPSTYQPPSSQSPTYQSPTYRSPPYMQGEIHDDTGGNVRQPQSQAPYSGPLNDGFISGQGQTGVQHRRSLGNREMQQRRQNESPQQPYGYDQSYEVSKLKADHAQEIANMKRVAEDEQVNTKRRFNDFVRELHQNHHDALTKQSQVHAVALEKQAKDHELEVSKQIETHQTSIKELHERFEADTRTLSDRHEHERENLLSKVGKIRIEVRGTRAQMAEMVQEHERVEARLRDEAEQQKNEFEVHIATLEAEQLANTKRIEAEHDKAMITMQQQHREEIDQLQKDKQEQMARTDEEHHIELKRMYAATEEKLSQMVQDIEMEKNSLIETLEKQKKAHRAELTAMADMAQEREFERQRVEDDMHKMMEEMDKMQRNVAQIEEERRKEQNEREQKRQDELTRLKLDHHEEQEGKERMKQEELAQLEKKHLEEQENQERIKQTEFARLKQEHLKAQDQLRKEIERRNKSQMSHLAQNYQIKHDRLATEMDVQNIAHKQEINDLKEENSRLISQVKRTYEQREAISKGEQAEKIKSLNDELQAALTIQDNSHKAELVGDGDIKPLEDGEIKSHFFSVVKLVDELGRLEWKEDQQVWKESVLNDLSINHNQRSLMKNIVEDDIWTSLYEHIFCTPFKIFGKEGANLDQQWYLRFTKDPQLGDKYVWPLPGIETERWRYATIKECRTVIRQPVPSEWDPRARLKKGFRTSFDALKSELITKLSSVVQLKEKDIIAVTNLIRKAANVWLEFGTQRCRIVLSLGEASLRSAEEKRRSALEGKLELTVVPSVWRHGNSSGFELDEFVPIKGCAEELLTLP